MTDGFRFNTDLLLEPTDAERAEKAFGAVFFALNDDMLRTRFRLHDKDANSAKRRSQSWGLTAVALVTLALLSASAEPLYHELGEPWLKLIAAAAALLGVGGAAIGIAGVRYGDRKHKWLVQRLITERLRQFHFQTLISHAPEIIAAAGDRCAEQSYLANRSARFEGFVASYISAAQGKLTAIIEGRAQNDTWLAPLDPLPEKFEGAAADQLLQALERLRIAHQLDFAEEKLSADHRLFSAKPRRQAAVLSGVALGAMAGLVLLHLFMLINVLLDAPGAIAPHAHVYVIALAIIALAIRTVEEGLQPQTEVERYRHYATALRQLSDRFKAAARGADKLAVLRDLEVAAYDEMVNFLKANHEVRFIV